MPISRRLKRVLAIALQDGSIISLTEFHGEISL